jgi:hypothetical protein
MVCGSCNNTLAQQDRRPRTVVDLTCQHKNQALLVEGPEIKIRPIGTRPQSMRGRFSAEQLQAMIDLYKSGATAQQLAKPLASANAASNGYSSNTTYAENTEADHDHSLLWYP